MMLIVALDLLLVVMALDALVDWIVICHHPFSMILNVSCVQNNIIQTTFSML